MNKYDIFISYNRATSCKVALDIYENLAKQEYKVFFELRKRELWEFDEQIRTNIENAQDVIVLLDEYSFKDLFEDLDYGIEHRLFRKVQEPYNRHYFCKELEFVMESKTVNVVPVLVDDYKLEVSKLPDGIKCLANLKAIGYNSETNVLDGELALKSKAGLEGSPSLLRIMEQYENDEDIKIEDSNIANSMTNIGYAIGYKGNQRKWINNIPKFVMYFSEKSANLGDRYGQQIYGGGLYSSFFDKEEGFVWLKKSAEQGDLVSLEHLGQWHYSTSSDKGLELLKKSAEGGYHMSQYWLAELYNEGELVERNYEESYYWYMKSATNGNIYSYGRLGDYYKYGLCVEKNIDKAIECYKKYTVLSRGTGGCAFVGYCLILKRDYEEAFKYFIKVKGRRTRFATPGLALCYQLGKGVEKDEAKAVSLWKSLIIDKRGCFAEPDRWEDYFACYHLARCYENGIGVRKNKAKAIKLYTLALKYEEDEYDYPEERFATLAKEALERLENI